MRLDTLKKQNAETSNALISYFDEHASDDLKVLFTKLAETEGEAIAQRDAEDAAKLQVGIDLAVRKGVIPAEIDVEEYVQVDVLGKTVDEVAGEILKVVGDSGDQAPLIVIVGLSGTGKGTTVSKLRDTLSLHGKNVVCWSNGNIFRSVTLLAVTWCEQNCIGNNDSGKFDASKSLTKENLASFMDMLEFGEFNNTGKFDTRIKGLGLDMFVSEVQNTELKVPKVSKNIPTVAEVTQGECINFASKAIQTLTQAGTTVLLEGREETVNYIKTPYRFALTMSDQALIGKRRAAQRVMAYALSCVSDTTTTTDSNNDDASMSAEKYLVQALKAMTADLY